MLAVHVVAAAQPDERRVAVAFALPLPLTLQLVRVAQSLAHSFATAAQSHALRVALELVERLVDGRALQAL